MNVVFNLDVSLWCENHTKGPVEMKETDEKESGVKYFKCTECDHEISIMLQSTL